VTTVVGVTGAGCVVGVVVGVGAGTRCEVTGASVVGVVVGVEAGVVVGVTGAW
jgi:hypothetical protein